MADSTWSYSCRFSVPPSSIRHMLLLSIVLALCSICSCTAAFAQEAPYKATWPAGWSVTELPGPRPYSEKDLGGKRIRVTKTDDGVVAAVIELTYFPRPGAAKVNLEDEFAAFLKTVKSGYEAKGYTVTEATPVLSSLGGLSDRQVEVTTNAKGYVLRQWTAMALGADSLYSLSFSGLEAKFEKYKPDFESCKQSLTLK